MLPRDELITKTELECDTGGVGVRNIKQRDRDQTVNGCAPGLANDAAEGPESKLSFYFSAVD